jgi:hypothetical protein
MATVVAMVAVLPQAGGGRATLPNALYLDCQGLRYGGSFTTCTVPPGCTNNAGSNGCTMQALSRPPARGSYRYENEGPVRQPSQIDSRQLLTRALSMKPTHQLASAQSGASVTAGQVASALDRIGPGFWSALRALQSMPALPTGYAGTGQRALGDAAFMLACRQSSRSIFCRALDPTDQPTGAWTLYFLSPTTSAPQPCTPARCRALRRQARAVYEQTLTERLGRSPSAAERTLLAWLLPPPPAG